MGAHSNSGVLRCNTIHYSKFMLIFRSNMVSPSSVSKLDRTDHSARIFPPEQRDQNKPLERNLKQHVSTYIKPSLNSINF